MSTLLYALVVWVVVIPIIVVAGAHGASSLFRRRNARLQPDDRERGLVVAFPRIPRGSEGGRDVMPVSGP